MKNIILTNPTVTGIIMLTGIITATVFIGIVIGFFIGRKSKPETREYDRVKSLFEISESRVKELEGAYLMQKNAFDMSYNRVMRVRA